MSEYWVAGQSKVSMQTAIQTSGAPTCGDGASRAANRERSARVAQNIFEVSSVAEKTMPPDEAGERRSTSAEEDVFHRRSNRLEAPAARALPEQTLEESVVRRFPTEERDERIHLVSAARSGSSLVSTWSNARQRILHDAPTAAGLQDLATVPLTGLLVHRVLLEDGLVHVGREDLRVEVACNKVSSANLVANRSAEIDGPP